VRPDCPARLDCPARPGCRAQLDYPAHLDYPAQPDRPVSRGLLGVVGRANRTAEGPTEKRRARAHRRRLVPAIPVRQHRAAVPARCGRRGAVPARCGRRGAAPRAHFRRRCRAAWAPVLRRQPAGPCPAGGRPAAGVLPTPAVRPASPVALRSAAASGPCPRAAVAADRPAHGGCARAGSAGPLARPAARRRDHAPGVRGRDPPPVAPRLASRRTVDRCWAGRRADPRAVGHRRVGHCDGPAAGRIDCPAAGRVCASRRPARLPGHRAPPVVRLRAGRPVVERAAVPAFAAAETQCGDPATACVQCPRSDRARAPRADRPPEHRAASRQWHCADHHPRARRDVHCPARCADHARAGWKAQRPARCAAPSRMDRTGADPQWAGRSRRSRCHGLSSWSAAVRDDVRTGPHDAARQRAHHWSGAAAPPTAHRSSDGAAAEAPRQARACRGRYPPSAHARCAGRRSSRAPPRGPAPARHRDPSAGRATGDRARHRPAARSRCWAGQNRPASLVSLLD